MAHRQRSRVTMLRRCFWSGAWFDSGIMFQRRRTVEVPISVHRQSGGFALLYRDKSAQCQTVQSRRLPCHGAEDVSLVPCSRPQRFPSCSLFPSCRPQRFPGPAVRVHAVWRQSRSHSCSPFFWTLSFARSLCATTDAHGRCPRAVHRRFSRPCDHAATFAQWKCSRFSYRR